MEAYDARSANDLAFKRFIELPARFGRGVFDDGFHGTGYLLLSVREIEATSQWASKIEAWAD